MHPQQTITVVDIPAEQIGGHITTADFCVRSGISARAVRRYKAKLVTAQHPLFEDYRAGDWLTSAQCELLQRMRSLTLRGLKGDALLEALYTESSLLDRLGESASYCAESLEIPEEKSRPLIAHIKEFLRDEIAGIV